MEVRVLASRYFLMSPIRELKNTYSWTLVPLDGWSGAVQSDLWY